MQTRIPQPIQPLLDEYLTLLEHDLPGLVTGFYLVGSIALDAFSERLSDVDFLAVVSRRCTDYDLERLASIHQQIARKLSQWPMEGNYLQWADLGKLDEALSLYPFYYEGNLHPSGHHDADSVLWWVLKTHGIAIIGPEPETLPFVVDWDVLIARMRENLNTYWIKFTINPRRMLWLLTDDGIQWAVLGVLRQFYTFEEHDITSKTGAGEYALTHLPAKWHQLIREAIKFREQSVASLYNSKFVRAMDTVRFLKYVIDSCNSGRIVVHSDK